MTNKPREILFTLGSNAMDEMMQSRGRMIRLNLQKVLDQDVVFKMSDIAGEYMSWAKNLWNSDRSLYNYIKEYREAMKGHKEMLRHKVMMSNELNVKTGSETLHQMSGIIKDTRRSAYMKGKNQSSDFDLMNSLEEQIDALLVLIEITDHEDSVWNKLK